MGIAKKTKVQNLENIRKDIQASSKIRADINQHRREIEAILAGTDSRTLLIVGPCSAWPSDAVREYAARLAPLAEAVAPEVKIVMRVYTQKPRTIKGWAGAVVQPDPFSAPNIEKGAQEVRKLMLKVASLGLPIADELLFTHKHEWIGDLLSWAAIGARSAEDQEHRVFASGLKMPVGIKNPTSGNLEIGVNGVISAQSDHTYYASGYQYETDGNPFAHLVLRGGSSGPNYHEKHIEQAGEFMASAGLANPAILIDASHDNTIRKGKKDYTRQATVIKSVLRSCTRNNTVKKMVKGFLIESFLREGNQNLATCTKDTVKMDGLSITDPCIGWQDTERLIYEIAHIKTHA